MWSVLLGQEDGASSDCHGMCHEESGVRKSFRKPITVQQLPDSLHRTDSPSLVLKARLFRE